MRNGNIVSLKISISSCFSSYPTYEEWKRCFTAPVNAVSVCSYPTYEEWKRKTVFKAEGFKLYGSYPTYEEWKLFEF